MLKNKRLKKIIVTGGAGFIGSAFVRLTVKEGFRVSVIDKLTYAGDLERLKEVKNNFAFYKADICSAKRIDAIFSKEKPQAVVNFAAESHVDRSILDANCFLQSNCIGTQVLLDASRRYKVQKFVHISTDEVYGEIIDGKFKENSALRPNSPYAASKAAADLLVGAYIRTYSFPAIIVRPSNNYGPWQYPEKLIPLAVLRLLRREKIPVYGKGINIREWLHVDDCVRGILAVLERGRKGETYNLGSGEEKKNIEVVRAILSYLDGKNNEFVFVKDRPGHDMRYSLDSSKVNKKIGWFAKTGFEEGLAKTMKWYMSNKEWILNKSR